MGTELLSVMLAALLLKYIDFPIVPVCREASCWRKESKAEFESGQAVASVYGELYT